MLELEDQIKREEIFIHFLKMGKDSAARIELGRQAVFGEMACSFFRALNQQIIYFVFFWDIQLFSSGFSFCYLHQSRKGLSQQTVEYQQY